MTSFIAFLRHTADGGFSIEFPDLPGCASAGTHVAQAGTLGGEELLRYLSALMVCGYPVPQPTLEPQLAQDPRRGAAELMAFEVDLEELGIADPLIYHTL